MARTRRAIRSRGLPSVALPSALPTEPLATPPGARLLAVLAELEVAERARRRIERHLNEARLPPDKTLDNFDFNHVPTLSRARVMALAAGDARLDKGSDVLLFGRPARAKATSRQRSDAP